jgi:RNA polymerase sigma factor (sigma-70 family)
MEDDLIRCAQAGDQAAFRQLVDTYTPIVWRAAQTLLPDRSSAEDVLQESWLDVWRGLLRFQRGRPFRPWLLTIVARRCSMTARRRSLSTVPFELEAMEHLPSEDRVSDRLLRLEADRAVQVVLETLPAEQQRILELRFFAGLELAEIALVMGTPLGTVKSRLHRALGILRKRLQGEEVRVQYQEKRR